MSYQDKVTLVTGATGFLGRHLCECLYKKGEYVRAVGRVRMDGPWREFEQWDFRRDGFPLRIMDNVKAVFHLAGRAHETGQIRCDLSEYKSVIVEGTRRLLSASACAGINKFIYFSSVKAMGEGNLERLPLMPLDESFPSNPQSPYGIAKCEAESLVRNSTLLHKVILRPVMVFGPGEKGNLPRMVQAVAKGRFPPIPDNGNKRSMVHAHDVVEWAIRSAEFPIAAGKTYILSQTHPISTRVLYDTIRELLNMPQQNWSVPLSLLKCAAIIGTTIHKLTGVNLPFDTQTLNKLTGSAWYSSALVQKELNYRPIYDVRNWLLKDKGGLT